MVNQLFFKVLSPRNVSSCCIAIVTLFFSCELFANNTDHHGRVTEIRFFTAGWTTYDRDDTGFAAIYFDPPLPKACGTGDTRFIIDHMHPLFNVVVSTALSAKITNADVMVNYLNSCNVRSNSWDIGTFRIN